MQMIKPIPHVISVGTAMLMLTGSHLQMLAQSSGNNPAETEPILEETHNRHERFADSFAHKNIILLLNKYSLPSESRDQLKHFFDAYLEVKDALARDDIEAADSWANAMRTRIEVVNLERFDGDGLKALKQHSRLMLENLKHFQHMESLEKKRTYFSHISEIAYCTVKSFYLEYEDLYSLYCPAAFSGKGAYWLSTTVGTRNPYLGKSKDDCGDISGEFLGTSKIPYISPFARRKKMR